MRSFYAKVGISIKEDPVEENLVKLAAVVPQATQEAVLAGGEIIRSRAYGLANVSAGYTGHARDGSHMRDNIGVTVVLDEHGATARIGIPLDNVPYAPHQEFGPNGKPFLRPAVDESRVEVHRVMKEVFAQATSQEMKVSTSVRFRRIA